MTSARAIATRCVARRKAAKDKIGFTPSTRPFCSKLTARFSASAFDKPNALIGASMTFFITVICGNRLKPETICRSFSYLPNMLFPARSPVAHFCGYASVTPLHLNGSGVYFSSGHQGAQYGGFLSKPLGPIIASFSAGATARLRSFITRRSPKYLST